MVLQSSSVPRGTIVGYGQPVPGEISPAGDEDIYSFQAQAGDVVRVRISEVGDFDPQIELFDDQGNLLNSDWDSYDTVLDTRLDTGGAFTILVSDIRGNGTGAYNLTLETP